MKKTLFLGFLTLFGLTLNGFAKTPISKTNTQWIVRGGLNFMNVVGSTYMSEYGGRVGYDLSVSFQKPIADFGLFWGMDMGLSSRGYGCKEKDYEDKYIMHNLKYAPFTFGYEYQITKDLTLDAHTSIYMSIDYAGKNKWRDLYGDDQSWDSESMKDFEDYMPFDMGFQWGIGLWWKQFNLDLMYQRGFINWTTESGYSWYASNFMLRLGYAF